MDRCSFTITDASGAARIQDRQFRPGTDHGPRRAFGMQFLEGEFSDLQETGIFLLEATIATSNGLRQLRSNPFEVRGRLVSETMLRPLTILNAQARRAADEDLRRNWIIESGPQAWSVGLDGAFVADRADDQAGATLRRVLNAGNGLLLESDFRFVCRITIVHGCDAQLQFRITDTVRWAVTLQAGDAGACAHGAGPGAVRLHREGPGVDQPDHFEAVASHRLDGAPFKIGRAYDVEVRAEKQDIQVFLDGLLVIDAEDPGEPQRGGFALKAWASTVRFEQANIWARHVALSHPAPGVWIPYDRTTGLSSQKFAITALDDDTSQGSPDSHDDILYPLAAQQHGFQDCNNFIGEVTSHSVFLASLMTVWQSRAHEATPPDQDSLRQAILTSALYLTELFEQGNRSGAFAHQEPGRGALNPDKPHVLGTQFAVYGLSSFAAAGLAIDGTHARRAFDLAVTGWDWLDTNGGRDSVNDSVFAIRLALAAERQGRPAGEWLARARHHAKCVLGQFSPQGAMAEMERQTSRSIPWFEGLFETFTSGRVAPDKDDRDKLASIADQLEALLDNPANAFRIIPQATGLAAASNNRSNWTNLSDLPLAAVPISSPPVGDWYVSTHFLTAAADCVYVGMLAGREALQRLATGNLYWALGLNPGIPTTKTVGSPPGSGPWGAASFVYNGPGAFARTIDGWRTEGSSAKGRMAPWEEPSGSRHRETWWIDPSRNGFQSIVNGHVLREGQWHYWSIGIDGWVSGETFLLDDAIFLRAAITLEDWRDGSPPARLSPYDTGTFRFFDTTHLDRAGTSWRFDDPDVTDWAQAQRMATDFAGGKGFGGGRPTGHHVGERVGVLCLPVSSTTLANVSHGEIAATKFPFYDINTAHWAQIGRAAADIAANHGCSAGYFTGHHSDHLHRWIGIHPELVTVFDIANDDSAVTSSQWRFPDINAVPWAQAARLATDICNTLGFAGGFFTGHQLPDRRQVAAFHRS